MFCKYCGKQLKDGTKFCGYCGKNLEQKTNLEIEKEIGKPIEKPIEKPISIVGKIEDVVEVQENIPVAENVNEQNINNNTSVPENIIVDNRLDFDESADDNGTKNNKSIIVVIIIVAVLLLLACGAFAFYYFNYLKNSNSNIEGDNQSEAEIVDDATSSDSISFEEKVPEDNTEVEEEKNKAELIDENDIEEDEDTKELKDLMSEKEIQDILDAYNDYIYENFDGYYSSIRAEYVNSDDIPEIFLENNDTTYLIGYLNDHPELVLGMTNKECLLEYDPNTGRIIVQGYNEESPRYLVYSIGNGQFGYVDGVQLIVDYSTGSVAYYRIDNVGNVIGMITQDEYNAFRNKYNNGISINLDLEDGFESISVEDAYNKLLGVDGASNKKGAKVTKIPIDNIIASSTLVANSVDNATYDATNMIDRNITTAWSEGVDGIGIGETIEIELNGVHDIACLRFNNGYLKSKNRYMINGTIKEVEIDYGNGTRQIVKFERNSFSDEDSNFTNLDVEPTIFIAPNDCKTDKIIITIKDAYAGTKYEDVCISEIEVYGR